MYQQILVMICLVLIRTKYHLLNIQKPIPLPVTDMSKNLVIWDKSAPTLKNWW